MELMDTKHKKLNHIVKLVNDSEISSIKSVVTGIVKIINDPDSSAKDLKDLIQVDPPLSAKLLKVANSAYYSRGNTITEIMQAVIWIGYEALKELALSQKVCEIFNTDNLIEGYSRTSLWKHSIAVAILAKMIYRREFGQRGEDIYAAGLLHDIGIIAEDQFMQREFLRVLKRLNGRIISLSNAEIQIFGFDHTDVGKAIAADWNLPPELVMSIGYHHEPFNADPEFLSMALTLYVADCLCQEHKIGFCGTPTRDKGLFQECIEHMDVKPYALELILDNTRHEISRLEDQGLL